MFSWEVREEMRSRRGFGLVALLWGGGAGVVDDIGVVAVEEVDVEEVRPKSSVDADVDDGDLGWVRGIAPSGPLG